MKATIGRGEIETADGQSWPTDVVRWESDDGRVVVVPIREHMTGRDLHGEFDRDEAIRQSRPLAEEQMETLGLRKFVGYR